MPGNGRANARLPEPPRYLECQDGASLSFRHARTARDRLTDEGVGVRGEQIGGRGGSLLGDPLEGVPSLALHINGHVDAVSVGWAAP